jgi:hypothetical protein
MIKCAKDSGHYQKKWFRLRRSFLLRLQPKLDQIKPPLWLGLRQLLETSLMLILNGINHPKSTNRSYLLRSIFPAVYLRLPPATI